MNPTLPVYAYGNVEALHGIFNFIAMVTGSGDFIAMVRLAVVIGFAVVLTLSLFPGHFQKGWTWFLAVTAVTSIFLVPKATVQIIDRTGLQATVVVDNVPWSLAMMASLKTVMGARLTELYETAAQSIPVAGRALPADLSYEQTGMMFGSRIVRASRAAVPENLYDRADLTQYMRNCVLPEQGRVRTPNQMADSVSLVSIVGDSNPALASGYHDPGNNWKLDIQPCPVVWNKLKTRLNTAGAAAVVKAAATTMPGLFQADQAAATAKVDAAMQAIYGKAALASAGASAADIMVQNILINTAAEAAASDAAALNDSASLMLGMMRTQAVAQMNAGNLVQGRIAEEALPMIRNLTEGILYLCFPVLVILLVASEPRAMGSLFKSYVYALVWVELWPVMFAAVNHLQTNEAARQLSGAAFKSGGGGGLSVSTASAIYSTAVSNLGVTAWMVTFVPVLAAAVVFGFDRIMAVTGAMGGGQRAAQSEASGAAKGNLSMGNMSAHQQMLASYYTSPSMMTTASVGGTETRDAVSGQSVSMWSRSQVLSSLQTTSSVGEGFGAAASAALSSSERAGQQAEKSYDAAYNEIRGVLEGYGTSGQRQFGVDVSRMGADAISESEVKEAGERLAQKYGIQDSSAVSRLLSAGLQPPPVPSLPTGAESDGSGGGRSADPAKVLNSAKADALKALAGMLPVSARGTSEESERLSRDYAAELDGLHKKSFARKRDLVDQFRSGESFAEARRSHADATQRVDASVRDAEAFRETEQRELSRSKQLSSQWEAFQRWAVQNTTDYSNLVAFELNMMGKSVHDGVADPRDHERAVRAVIAKGSFRSDTADGRTMFVPLAPDYGMAPDVVKTSEGLRGLTEDGLRTEQANQPAAGVGRKAVDAHLAAARTKEQRTEATLGIGATRKVTGDDLVVRTQEGQAGADKAARGTKSEVEASAGSRREAYDARKGDLSPHHKPVPIGDRRNVALDAINHDGHKLPFAAEAAAARQTRGQEDAKRRNEPRAEIPTKPPESAPRRQEK